MSHNPNISVIIPVKNGADTIDDCLKAVFKQTLIHLTEVIIIDSGSTDHSLEIIKKYPVRLYQISPKEFGHGKTRNFGVSLAKGKFIVMTVQDARPATNDWLEILLSNFHDKEIVAVCGQQAVPHEKDKNPLQWYRPVSKADTQTVQFKSGEFEKLNPFEQRKYCSWDDVNAMYRKSILQKVPFEDVAFGEDMIWAKTVLIQGYKIAYDMRARVWHYHHYTNLEKLKYRVFNELYFKYKTFGLIPENIYNFKHFIKIIFFCIKYKVGLNWWIYNLKINLIMRKETIKFIKRYAK